MHFNELEVLNVSEMNYIDLEIMTFNLLGIHSIFSNIEKPSIWKLKAAPSPVY